MSTRKTLNIDDFLTEEHHLITFPIITSYFAVAEPYLKSLGKVSYEVKFENRVTLGAYRFLAKKHTYKVVNGYCSATDEPLKIHYCRFNGIEYEIAVMEGAFNRKHRNFKRPDKVCICSVEIR